MASCCLPTMKDMEEEVASRDNDEYDGGSWASNTRVLADKYEVLQVVGEGAYGLVMKCKVAPPLISRAKNKGGSDLFMILHFR